MARGRRSADRALPPGTFDAGIALPDDMRGRGYGREASRCSPAGCLSTPAPQAVEAPTDRANVAMHTVFDRCG